MLTLARLRQQLPMKATWDRLWLEWRCLSQFASPSRFNLAMSAKESRGGNMYEYILHQLNFVSDKPSRSATLTAHIQVMSIKITSPEKCGYRHIWEPIPSTISEKFKVSYAWIIRPPIAYCNSVVSAVHLRTQSYSLFQDSRVLPRQVWRNLMNNWSEDNPEVKVLRRNSYNYNLEMTDVNTAPQTWRNLPLDPRWYQPYFGSVNAVSDIAIMATYNSDFPRMYKFLVEKSL